VGNDPLDGIPPEELERYLQAELARMRRDPLNNSYPLHAQQLQWVRCTSRRIIVVSANRLGKTESVMRDVLWCARGQHPHKSVGPHSVIWVGSPDYPSYLQYHKPAFDKWCPPDWLIGDFHETDKIAEIRRADGGVCEIHFLS
jgi:hypothetical protein